jgi:hypothetical protein
MKKTILIAATALLVACGHNKISDLHLNVDKPQDVEAKFGKPDSIARHAFLGLTAEFWAYRKDSICLLFKNDILSEAQEHCFGGFGPTEAEKMEMAANAKRMGDSISESLSSELEAAMNKIASDTLK